MALNTGRRGRALCLAAALVSTAAVQSTEMLPGRYEGIIEATIMGEPGPPEKDDQCFTADDVKQIDKWIASTLGKECKVSDRKVDGGKQTFAVTCASDAPGAISRVELITGRDTLNATIRTTEPAAGETVEGTITIKAKRVGDCTK